ncbi:hypothetical protein Tco_1514938 [Tanacetum coccineum]
MQERPNLSKTQGSSTAKEARLMQRAPYASAIGSIMNTKDMFIVYGGDLKRELKVTGYTDVGFETDKDDRKSQTEAEYIAASEAAMEAVWIRKFISRLGVVPINKEPMKIYYDNTCAIIIANEPGVQRGARHDNLADPFTKPLSCTKHIEHARSIGLRPTNSLM